MEETRNTIALVLNRQSYRENDSLVVVYTEKFGKLSLIARGTKKLQSKLAGHLEPINLIDLMIINGRQRDYVGSALTRKAFLNIKGDLNKIYYAGQIITRFKRLIKENQVDQELFFLLNNWLEGLDNYQATFSKETGELFLSSFSLRLLSILGYRPEMYYCLDCRQKIKPGHNYFDLQNGGVICEACFGQKASKAELVSLSNDCLKLIRFIMTNEANRAGKLRLAKKLVKELTNLTTNFINFNN